MKKTAGKLLGVSILLVGSVMATLIGIEVGEWSGSRLLRIVTITVLWIPVAIIYVKWFTGNKK